MDTAIKNIPLSEVHSLAEPVPSEYHAFIDEIREATTHAAAIRESVASAASNLGLNMLSANQELVQAHRQLCNVLNLAEVKQRSAIDRLEKQSRKTLHEVMFRAIMVLGISAGIGGVVGGAITQLAFR
ncbi:hypothetical protein [Pseudomonas sp. NPDC089569]|uniref:hypothetical protein n=1 Tax=Pseudomonas sp. NPDC089569 TaxID=3390722 RepID=UPI003D007CED